MDLIFSTLWLKTKEISWGIAWVTTVHDNVNKEDSSLIGWLWHFDPNETFINSNSGESFAHYAPFIYLSKKYYWFFSGLHHYKQITWPTDHKGKSKCLLYFGICSVAVCISCDQSSSCYCRCSLWLVRVIDALICCALLHFICDLKTTTDECTM